MDTLPTEDPGAARQCFPSHPSFKIQVLCTSFIVLEGRNEKQKEGAGFIKATLAAGG